MRRALVLPLALLASAGLGACGGSDAVTPPRPGVVGAHAVVPRPYNPMTNVVACLHGEGIATRPTAPNEVRLAPAATGMRVRLAITPGAADAAQLRGGAEGAEVIGSAMLFVGSASDAQIARVERCLNDVAPQGRG